MSDDGVIHNFREKNEMDNDRINGGYMVLEPEVFKYLEDDTTVFEKKPLVSLANDGQLMGYQYDGYWQCMDTKREKDLLDKLIEEKKAPWMKWDK